MLPLVGVLASPTADADAGSFREQQLRYPRVRTAYERKATGLRALFSDKKIPWPPQRLFLRVFKSDAALEVWAPAESGNRFELVTTYPICSSSGTLGPKRQEGDGQVPEGFYTISDFNPTSTYHLSLRVDYPNASDRLLGKRGRLGGAIFIHGSCITLGCIPITDDNIEELYVLAVEARSAGPNRIMLHIFPARLTEENLEKLRAEFTGQLVSFWDGLRPGYDSFERHRQLPLIRIGAAGEYSVVLQPKRGPRP